MGIRKYIWTPLLIAALLPAACAHQSRDAEPIHGLSASDSNQLNAQYARFETSQDPPLSSDTHFAAAQFAESQGAYPKAIEQYRAALQLDPRHCGAQYRLAILYTKLAAYPEAIAAWKAYLAASGEDATAYSNLAFCYQLAGMPADAESTYKQGLAKDAQNAPCRINYGLMLARAGRTDEAVAQWQIVLTPAQLHYNLGSVFEELGRKDQARSEYRKAAELDPKLLDAKARLSALD